MPGDDERRQATGAGATARRVEPAMAEADDAALRDMLETLDASVAEITRPLLALRQRIAKSPGDLREIEAALARAAATEPLPKDAIERALSRVRETRTRRRLSFSADLHRACAKAGVTPRRISDRPEQWRIGPLCIGVDRTADRAVIRYARAPVVTRVPCDAAAVLRALRKAAQKLDRGSIPPDSFGALLVESYRNVLAAAGQKAGLVALVDVYAELRRQLARTYTRAQFAYDLGRLRRERRLIHEGMRIDLGIATGHATRRKSRVIWIEDRAGTGHYYASFRLVAAPSATMRSVHAQE